jgi:hypothetical protein
MSSGELELPSFEGYDESMSLADELGLTALDTTIVPPPSKAKVGAESWWLPEEDAPTIEMTVTKVDGEIEVNALKKINGILESAALQSIFTLNQPMMVTVKSDGGYRKVAHMGGERFMPKSLYRGVKSVIIVCSMESSSSQVAEFSKADASRAFSGFDKWYDGLLGQHESNVLVGAKITETEVEEEASKRYEAQGDTNFGSW